MLDIADKGTLYLIPLFVIARSSTWRLSVVLRIRLLSSITFSMAEPIRVKGADPSNAILVVEMVSLCSRSRSESSALLPSPCGLVAEGELDFDGIDVLVGSIMGEDRHEDDRLVLETVESSCSLMCTSSISNSAVAVEILQCASSVDEEDCGINDRLRESSTARLLNAASSRKVIFGRPDILKKK